MKEHLYRPDGKPLRDRHSPALASLEDKQPLQDKLLAEIIDLERRLQDLKASAANQSLVQTYKEMLHSRRTFYDEINRY